MSINPLVLSAALATLLLTGCSTINHAKIEHSRQQAGRLHYEGLVLMEQLDYAGAVAKFGAIVRDSRFGSWSTRQGFSMYRHFAARDLAECQARLGKIGAAEDSYRTALKYPPTGEWNSRTPEMEMVRSMIANAMRAQGKNSGRQ